MSIFYIDLDNGSDAASGADWANAWKTVTLGATAARIAPGDEIRISKTPDPTSIGNATFTDLSKTVTLAAAQTADVDLCESGWTNANGSTVATNTDRKQGSVSYRTTAPASPATNTLYAYKTITSTNFSSRQELSFWMKNEVALADGNWKVCLCSDTAGATIVDTFEIGAVASAALWMPRVITKSGGGNLGSAIQSVAIYSSTAAPTASKYIAIDNIIACTLNGMNLTTLIGKSSSNQTGEAHIGIQSIDGTTVLLDNDPQTQATAGRGYSGTTETVTAYIVQTFKTALATATTTAINDVTDSGTAGNLIYYKFGYEVGTTNQNGATVFDGSNGNGYGLNLSSKNYNSVSYAGSVRYNRGIYNGGSNNTFTTCTIQNNANIGIYNTGSNNTFTTCTIQNNASYGIYNGGSNNIYITCTIQNNASYGIYNGGSNNIYITCTVQNNTSYGIYNGGDIFLKNSTINETIEVQTVANGDFWTWSLNHDNTTGNHWGFTDDATINWQTTTKQNSTGSWKTSITGSSRNTGYPVKLKIAEVAFVASSLVTVTAYVKKDHATNVGCRLVAYANSSVGITEQQDVKVDDIDWELLTITFTPTSAGVTEIHLETWYSAGNSNTYVAPITVTQAT